MSYKLVLDIVNKPQENDILRYRNGNVYWENPGISPDVVYSLLKEADEKIKLLEERVNSIEEKLLNQEKEIKILKGEE